MKPIMIVSTYPDKKSITKIANQLIKNRFVVCVNIIKIDSIFTWKQKIEHETEYLVFFKTTQKNKKILKNKIAETHPYDVPEIAEINITSINKPYLNWLISSTL
jgi:periplasmic divalent cation tolerance protein